MARGKDLRVSLGQKIREFRLALGLSPIEFGDDIGKNQYYVLQLEDGKIDIDLLTLEKCAKALGLEISELFDAVYSDSVPMLLVDDSEQARTHG
jgi:transcriptional regulator with XRE-family HTH domain